LGGDQRGERNQEVGEGDQYEEQMEEHGKEGKGA
jgi:hypothetical protein